VRVGHQVDQDLPHSQRVRQAAREPRRQVEVEPLVLLGQPGGHHRRHLANQLREVEQARVHLHLAGLQARGVEQVVHEVDEAVRALEDHSDELLLASAEGLGAAEQLDEALDRRERAAQLVRGGGHEVRLHPVEARAL
jgi:hypothetical protein